MSLAPPYNPIASFANDETNQVAGRSTVRTVAVDTELANIATTVNALKSNLEKVQRDDDKLQDFLVEPYALSEQTRALISAGGKPRGPWLAGVQYAVGDIIQQLSVAYICYTVHLSSNPFTANGFWISISGDGSAAVSAAAAAASEALATAGAATAMTQAGIATTQAGIATTQATASATSANASGNAATAALASQTAAAASASDAAASFDSFDDRYLGAKAAEPALDNDGNALLTGALYYRTTAPVGMKVFGGATWAAAAALAPSAFIETLLDDANAAAARATLELGIVATQNTVPIAQGGTGAATELAARASLGVARGIEPIAASVASNNLTITINPTTLDFRSTTLGDGAVSTVSLASAVSCVVPNGATLGSIPAFLTRLAVLAINNAGTIEVAVVALTGSVDLSEKGLISTTALSTGADSDNVVYSTTARTNVAYRLVGFIEYTQAAAGVYATAPSLVGGNSSPLAMWLAGYGRKWQTVTRTSGVNYTNLTGRDIQFLVTGNNSAATQVTCAVDNFAFPTTIQSAGGVFSILADYPIPPGSVYTYTVAVGTVTVSELR